MWYRIVQSGPEPPIAGGAWNNDSTASPDDLSGGIAFNQGNCLSEPIYLTGCGTGDGGVNMNFGGPLFGQPYFGSLPLTYFPGWLNSFGGPDTWDTGSLQGSATITDAGTKLNFPSSPGAGRSVTGQLFGRYYVEYTLSYDIFSQQCGAGPMRKGALLNFIQQGRQNSSDLFGGAMIQGGNIGTTPEYQTSVNAFGAGYATSSVLPAPSQTIIGLAIALIPVANFIPQPFVGVQLPHMICCPENQSLARVSRK